MPQEQNVDTYRRSCSFYPLTGRKHFALQCYKWHEARAMKRHVYVHITYQDARVEKLASSDADNIDIGVDLTSFSGSRGIKRQCEPEGRAVAGDAIQPDPTMVPLNNAPTDMQADAQADA